MNGSWAINIDVEGFSRNYEYSEERKSFAIFALSELMNCILKIGRKCFPGKPDTDYSERLFAHQFGDGFIIVSDYAEQDASRAISLAIAMMRHMILKGFATKAAISCGELSDIRGCYPKVVRESDDERVSMGMGLMTVMSVMGTALTKAHKLSLVHKGAVLIVDEELIKLGLPEDIMKIKIESVFCIDWIASKAPGSETIAEIAGLLTGNSQILHEKLTQYCEMRPAPPQSWIEATYAACDATSA